MFSIGFNLVRFWGWTENAREQELAKAEVASGDVPGQGKSSLTDELQGVAHRNSAFSQLNLGTSVLFRVGAFFSSPCCLYTD